MSQFLVVLANVVALDRRKSLVVKKGLLGFWVNGSDHGDLACAKESLLVLKWQLLVGLAVIPWS